MIHALSGEQDLRNMGGLRKKIPVTFWTMMCAAVAIAGVPPFSGFFSKDAILVAAYHHAPWMYWVGVITAGMTAFYVFRAMFLTFFGEYRGHEHPHESPPVMTLPLAVLALLSLGGGFLSMFRSSWNRCSPPRRSARRSVADGDLGRRRARRASAWPSCMYVAQPGAAGFVWPRVSGGSTRWSTTSTSWTRSTTPRW